MTLPQLRNTEFFFFGAFSSLKDKFKSCFGGINLGCNFTIRIKKINKSKAGQSGGASHLLQVHYRHPSAACIDLQDKQKLPNARAPGRILFSAPHEVKKQ